MDAKTAVEILKSTIISYAPPIMGTKPISIGRCEEIADFIEQQEKVIFRLKSKVREFIHPLDVAELEKYAKLGRLIIEYPDGICHITHYDEKWSACRQCRSLKACQTRAELLGDRCDVVRCSCCNKPFDIERMLTNCDNCGLTMICDNCYKKHKCEWDGE